MVSLTIILSLSSTKPTSTTTDSTSKTDTVGREVSRVLPGIPVTWRTNIDWLRLLGIS